jgi:hypothetical protein
VRLLLLLLLTGCPSTKLLQLENQALSRKAADLSEELEQCNSKVLPEDYAIQVDLQTITGFLTKAGFADHKIANDRVVTVPVKGKNTSFQLNIQLFERERVLFMVATGYLRLEQATTSKSMVLLLTQLAAMNYDLLIGKFQLNPGTGDITISAELNLDDGMGYQTFQSVLNHLIKTADEKYPDLVRAAKGQGI